MRIGYLHLGDPEHGVTRYGRLLSGAARADPGLHVTDVHLVLGSDPRETGRRLEAAARRFDDVDIVHVQYNNQIKRSLWGVGWTQLRNLATFARRCRPPLVATLHDVQEPPRLESLVAAACRRIRVGLDRSSEGGEAVPPISRPRPASVGAGSLTRAVAVRIVLTYVNRAVVCSADELRRLRFRPGAGPVSVIPHFVESRSIGIGTTEAKASLGLERSRVITMLGFIHPRKGWRLLVDAIPRLPEDVVLLFAGGSSTSGDTAGEIRRIAGHLGVSARVRVTGYLAEPELEACLAATDLAICPFESVSASSSLSTWISVPRRILATELPLFREYDRLAPGSIESFAPYTADALARRIVECLTADPVPGLERVRKLGERLSMQATLERHVRIYGEALDGHRGAGSAARRFRGSDEIAAFSPMGGPGSGATRSEAVGR